MMMKIPFKWLTVTFAVLWFVGCSTTPTPPIRDVPYTFAEHESAHGTAVIIFPRHIRIVDFEGEQLPEPDSGTRWYPLLFPAGREFNMRVYVAYYGDTPGYRRRGIFRGPPLEAGKTYKIWYEPAKINYHSGAGKLILTYGKVKELKYFLGIPRYKRIGVQEIPPL